MEGLELRFELRGLPGTVRVRQGVNEDPGRWGYHVLELPDLPLCGFSWGLDVADGAPAPGPVAPAGPERWAAMVPALGAACPTWTFR